MSGGERLVACGGGGRLGRVLLDDLGQQRHLFDRAQRIFLLALDQLVDARDELVGVLAVVPAVHGPACARSWLRIA